MAHSIRELTSKLTQSGGAALEPEAAPAGAAALPRSGQESSRVRERGFTAPLSPSGAPGLGMPGHSARSPRPQHGCPTPHGNPGARGPPPPSQPLGGGTSSAPGLARYRPPAPPPGQEREWCPAPPPCGMRRDPAAPPRPHPDGPAGAADRSPPVAPAPALRSPP